jgi:hypothetical protein
MIESVWGAARYWALLAECFECLTPRATQLWNTAFA